jgi:hypothetical protein
MWSAQIEWKALHSPPRSIETAVLLLSKGLNKSTVVLQRTVICGIRREFVQDEREAIWRHMAQPERWAVDFDLLRSAASETLSCGSKIVWTSLFNSVPWLAVPMSLKVRRIKA